MKFHRIEHIGFFDHGTFFQVSLTEIPAFFHIVPKIIDGEQFSSSRFGIDVWRDLNSGQFTALTDVDVLGVERTFYYIASDGRKSWVEAELSSNFYQEIFTACEQAAQLTPGFVSWLSPAGHAAPGTLYERWNHKHDSQGRKDGRDRGQPHPSH